MPEIQRRFRGTEARIGQQVGLMNTVQRVRVGAYCRVSTSQDLQLGSLETQMNVFKNRIMEHPGWELVDIYADEGLSGTSVQKRKEFKRMAQDVADGKLDYIITKSISRFARNTVECLSYVRQFKSQGAHIYFEKERVDTGSEISEMLITILAAFAQEESKSISDHLKWGLRKRFEEGTVRWCNLYGYRQGENGDYVIEPLEAETVRRIFNSYLRGYSSADIANSLNEEGIPTSEGSKWESARVMEIIKNERYAGDIHLQKFVSHDHLSHRSKRNDETLVPSFYVNNHHEGIISREVFHRAQRTRELKIEMPGRTEQYPYADVGLKCPYCGEQLVKRRTAVKTGFYAWGCFGEKGCGQYGLRDQYLDQYMNACYEQRWGKVFEGKIITRKQNGKIVEILPVQYGWLDELVERIELSETSVRVIWKDGAETEKAFGFSDGRNKPGHIARRYQEYVANHPDGEYRPRPVSYKK